MAISIGGILLYSAFKGISVVDVFRGVKGDSLNPKGSNPNVGNPDSGVELDITGDLTPSGRYTFKGPNAKLLDALAGVAEREFDLTITSTSGGVHSLNSWHPKGRAFDASGSAANMRAFSQYVLAHYKGSLLELIHNPGFAVKNGMEVSSLVFAAVWAGHKNHVHVAM